MISDKTDSSSDKNTKKAKNKVLGHLLSLFFGILLGGLLCLLLVVAARHMGLISFGEADSFYDTAVSYYSEQFGDAASAQSQDPPSFARFYTRAADTSILNSDVSLDLERILQENVLLEGEGSEDADTADSDRFPCKRDHRKEDTSGIKTSGKLHLGRHFPRLYGSYGKSLLSGSYPA